MAATCAQYLAFRKAWRSCLQMNTVLHYGPVLVLGIGIGRTQ